METGRTLRSYEQPKFCSHPVRSVKAKVKGEAETAKNEALKLMVGNSLRGNFLVTHPLPKIINQIMI